MAVKTQTQGRAAASTKTTARITALEKQVKLLRRKLDTALEHLAVLERCVTVGSDGSVTLAAGGDVRIAAGAAVMIAAAQTYIEAGIVRASGVVACDVIQANSVIATTYTPGAGNIS